MARISYIIFLAAFLASCAQVGTISGGERDTSAPQPTKNVNPPNASTNFNVNEIAIPFNEYFTLSDPRSTILMVPPHATLETRVKKKTLYISWEDTLQENTTYAIYLNEAVKDYTEGNDSIMQYVFSTGDVIDSLSLNLAVVDAFDNKGVKDIIVALYDPSTNELLNFGQTDMNGVVSLNYLAAKTYNLFAFKDLNGDLLPQATEKTAFLETDAITIDSTTTIGEPLRLFKSLKEPKITSLTYQAPGTFFIGFNRDLNYSETELYLNKSIIPKSNYQFIEKDSLQLFLKSDALSSGDFVLTSQKFTDTIDYRVLESQKEGEITIKASHLDGVYGEHEKVQFVVNDLIESFDSTKITIRSIEDSSVVRPESIRWNFDTLSFEMKKSVSAQDIEFNFEAGAVTTLNGSSVAFKKPVTVYPPRKYGSLSVDLSYYQTPIILQVMSGQNLAREIFLSNTEEKVKIENLSKGSYSFRVILDDNQNGKWDTGDFKTRTQPEKVDYYSTGTTVRSNWNVDVELIPESESKTDEEPTE